MSVRTANDSRSIARTRLQSNATCVSNETTYRKAINEIRSRIKDASRKAVHIYAFNIPVEQLASAYSLLDKEEERRTMRVTYSDKDNFIVRYMPSRVHQETLAHWSLNLSASLTLLTPVPHPLLPPGIVAIGATSIQLGPRQKQPDAGVRPATDLTPDRLPSVVLEVGSSESLQQLRIDARLWIEHLPEVWLVIIVWIDHPSPLHPTLPIINIELWRSIIPSRPVRSQYTQAREGQRVWQANWTHAATSLYILLSDIFRGQVPPAYGNNDRVWLNTVAWRQAIIDSW